MFTVYFRFINNAVEPDQNEIQVSNVVLDDVLGL